MTVNLLYIGPKQTGIITNIWLHYKLKILEFHFYTKYFYENLDSCLEWWSTKMDL